MKVQRDGSHNGQPSFRFSDLPFTVDLNTVGLIDVSLLTYVGPDGVHFYPSGETLRLMWHSETITPDDLRRIEAAIQRATGITDSLVLVS